MDATSSSEKTDLEPYSLWSFIGSFVFYKLQLIRTAPEHRFASETTRTVLVSLLKLYFIEYVFLDISLEILLLCNEQTNNLAVYLTLIHTNKTCSCKRKASLSYMVFFTCTTVFDKLPWCNVTI